MRFQIVDECETCHGSGVVMSEAALQASGDPTVDCPEGGWSDEPTLICNTTRVASTTDLIEELKARGARENRRNSQSVTLTCALDGETVGADDQLVEAIRQLLWDMRNRGTYEAKARAVYDLVYRLEGEKP